MGYVSVYIYRETCFRSGGALTLSSRMEVDLIIARVRVLWIFYELEVNRTFLYSPTWPNVSALIFCVPFSRDRSLTSML